LAVRRRNCKFGGMAQHSEQLERLVGELAQLDPVDQARVIAGAAQLRRGETGSGKFVPPTLQGGSEWIGGELSREALYGGDRGCRAACWRC